MKRKWNVRLQEHRDPRKTGGLYGDSQNTSTMREQAGREVRRRFGPLYERDHHALVEACYQLPPDMRRLFLSKVRPRRPSKEVKSRAFADFVMGR